jgi:hypothetical protein
VLEQQLAKQATQNPQAYQLYLNGLSYRRKGNNIENFRKALDYSTQALALDPKFALAYTGMPFAYLNLASNSSKLTHTTTTCAPKRASKTSCAAPGCRSKLFEA